MASTDSNESSGKQRTQPMTGNAAPPPSGYETLRPDQGVAPFAETAPPGMKVPIAVPSPHAETRPPNETPPDAPPGYSETMAPTKPSDGPAAAVPAAMPGMVVCGYKLGKMLGRGGFGKVYLGEAAGGVPVAVKIVEAPRDSNEAAQRELQALEVIKKVRHPFLLMTHAFHSLEDQLVIAMELADGSLRDELEKNRRKGTSGIPPQELIRHMIESSEALDYLHDRKMNHRDIKPENILLLSGHAKLADFGLVRVVQENRAQASVSLTGTLAYMAPEVFRGHTHVNSDQYALALTYLELRFGERFVTTNDLVEAMLKHVEHQPDLSRLEPHERSVIEKALAKDPDHRWRSCTEMARALAEGFGRTELRGGSAAAVVEKPAGPRAVPPKAKSPATQPKRKSDGRKRLGIILAGVAALAIVGSVALVISGYFSKSKSGPEIPEQPSDNWPANVVRPTIAPRCKLAPADEAVIVNDNGKDYYSEIDLILDPETRIRFILIPQLSAGGQGLRLPAFYIMRDKVSYQLFQKFVNDSGVKLKTNQWEAGAIVDDKKVVNPPWPVMAVTAADSQLFAEWLRGDLPGVEQWKKAAGFYDQRGRAGPYIELPEGRKEWEKGEIGCDRAELGPLPVGTATKDISVYKVRDMAGNGKEWTHNLHNSTDRVPLDHEPGEFDRVIQVGKLYMDSEPLRFTDLYPPEKLTTEKYALPDPYCSFRVVLKLP